MVDEIVQREWDFFQLVHHIDGRASCQDDFETFYLQRKSQFLALNYEVQCSYLNDLKQAKTMGRNPVMEKYAYMMAYTDPQYYDTIKDQLPPISEEKKQFVDTFCEIEVQMREEFNQKYPHLAALARNTHSFEDEKEDTSFETYLRGELYTYSMNTLYEYGKMLADLMNKHLNLITMIMEQTVLSYGYCSLEHAEEKYAGLR